MAAATTYSADEDLAVYVPDVALPLPLTAQHQEAAKEINRTLRAQLRNDGYSATDIETKLGQLSALTLADLKTAAAFYVLYLVFMSYRDGAFIDRADRYLRDYQRVMVDTRIEIDTDSDTVPENVISWGGKVARG